MVAAAHRIEAEQPDVAGENRVWDFLGASPNRLGQAATQVADCDWEKGLVGYDWRRGPSLAQRDQAQSKGKVGTALSQEIVDAALELIKATEPGYYENLIGGLRIEAVTRDSQVLKKHPNASGASDTLNGIIYINLDKTVAFEKFKGTAEQFAALVILHEASHIAYRREGKRNDPNGTRAIEEASIRYWVEDWAIRNDIPETVPNARSGTGPPFTPDYSEIYKRVLRDGYSTEPFKTIPPKP